MLLVHVEGTLTSAPNGAAALVLGPGSMPLADLGEAIRSLPGRVTLVSTRFRTGPVWRVTDVATPGSSPLPGCLDPGRRPRSGIADLRGTALPALVAALSAGGEGDEGIAVSDLLRELGFASGAELLPYDPHARLTRPGVVR